MTEFRFYHLQRRTLEQALPQLLERILDRGLRAVVLAGSPERVEALSLALWTYDPASFLPHGSARDGSAEWQPIWLTSTEERPNQATVLVLVDGAEADRPADFDIVCDVFDGNNPDAVAGARRRWRTAKAGGHNLTYWQQTSQGGWQKAGS